TIIYKHDYEMDNVEKFKILAETNINIMKFRNITETKKEIVNNKKVKVFERYNISEICALSKFNPKTCIHTGQIQPGFNNVRGDQNIVFPLSERNRSHIQ
ncbi:MAG: hypothetical protein P8Y30_07485, partial [candidate division WOR-3 bacterium]